MAKRHAIIEGVDVVNIILLDDDFDHTSFDVPPEQILKEAPDEVAMGWKWRNDEWEEPEPEPLPEAPAEPPAERTAKETAVSELIEIGISEVSARLIVGLPPLEA